MCPDWEKCFLQPHNITSKAAFSTGGTKDHGKIYDGTVRKKSCATRDFCRFAYVGKNHTCDRVKSNIVFKDRETKETGASADANAPVID